MNTAVRLHHGSLTQRGQRDRVMLEYPTRKQ